MNIYVAWAIVVATYVFLGLIFMGIESRWKLTAYVNAVRFEVIRGETTYKERVSTEKRDPTYHGRQGKRSIKSMFFLWWLFLIMVLCICLAYGILFVGLKIWSFVSGIWNFFYNGFRSNPPSQGNIGSGRSID